MSTHNYIEPHQLNTFVYCKRRWYYQNRLKLAIINYHMQIGTYVQENYWRKAIKRKELYLISHKLKIKGKCDYIVEENGVQIPIEIKKGKCNSKKPFKNDIMQLLCYILLLEEHFGVTYPYGYILYVGSKRKYKINITLVLRRSIKYYFKKIYSYLRSGKLPKKQNNKNKCRGCSYEDYCWC